MSEEPSRRRFVLTLGTTGLAAAVAALEALGAHQVTAWDDLSVTLQWTAPEGTMTIPLVRGSPYLTATYDGVTPMLTSAFVMDLGDSPNPGTRAEVTLSDGSTWDGVPVGVAPDKGDMYMTKAVQVHVLAGTIHVHNIVLEDLRHVTPLGYPPLRHFFDGNAGDIERLLAGELEAHVVLGQQQVPRACPGPGLVLAHPQHLGRRVARECIVAGDGDEALAPHGLAHPVHLSLCPTVVPEDGRSDHFAGLVEQPFELLREIERRSRQAHGGPDSSAMAVPSTWARW